MNKYPLSLRRRLACFAVGVAVSGKSQRGKQADNDDYAEDLNQCKSVPFHKKLLDFVSIWEYNI